MSAEVCSTTGKTRYTRKRAISQASWWRRVRFARMTHYHCRHCGAWHVGNDRGRLPRRVAA